MEGWALSWQLTGDTAFAEKSLAAMRANHLANGAKPSRSWVDYARWSLAFDWLFEYPGFESCAQGPNCERIDGRCGGDVGHRRFQRPRNVFLSQLRAHATSRCRHLSRPRSMATPDARIVAKPGAKRPRNASQTFSRPPISPLPRAATTSRWITCASLGPL